MIPRPENIAARAATPVMALIVLGMAYTLASTLWFLAVPPETALAEPRKTAQGTPGGVRPSIDLESIFSANLFGVADAKTAQATANETLAETRLPLVLHGVFVARTPEQSTAILARKGRSEELFHIGDQVPGNATLEAVHLDHVRLRRGRVRERLAFPRPNERLATPSDPVEQAQSTGFDTQALLAESSSLPSRAPARLDPGSQSPESPQKMAERYRESLKSDPGNALIELGLTPMSGDAAAGYRLDRLAQSPYLRQTGLKPGDVILSINGQPLGNVGRDQLELDNVLAQGSARLEVQRGARRFFIEASLK